MLETRVNQAVKLIKDFLKGRDIAIAKVVIFGSYARAAATKDSDVDVAIISPDFDGKDIFLRAEMLKGLKWVLADKIDLPFDIISISSREWDEETSFMVDAIKSGIYSAV